MINKPLPGQRLNTDYFGKVVDKLNFSKDEYFRNTLNDSIIVAEITEMTATDGVYKWKQVVWDEDSSDWVYTGRKGDAEIDSYAIEVNESTEVTEGAYVYLIESSNGHHRWTFKWHVGTTDSTASVGTTAETEAEQTDDWDRTSQGANDGVVVTMLTRMAYDHTGDEKLYAYYRSFTYDSLGMLVDISTETRVIIDTPEAC